MKFLVFLLFLVSLSGCCSTSKSINQSKLIYTINFGSGGGFTGNYDGYVIDTTGSIVSWRGKTLESAKIQEIGKLTSVEINELNTLITNLNIINTDYRQSGNMTQFIILSLNSTEHRISWEGFTPGRDVPQNVQTFYKKLNEIIGKFNK